ncbi:MAG: L-aspartate oxidase [Alphaproteobacteria bacterium]|nr:L-aspartate oxidase [Alphaproteobacteria bacterium]
MKPVISHSARHPNDLPKNYDVIIVGAGMAGLLIALQLAPLKTLLINGQDPTQSSSSQLAQGGIAAAVSTKDHWHKHKEDTLLTSQGLADEEAITLLTQNAKNAINQLEEFGVSFDKDTSGNFSLGREGAHSESRILHIAGDATGAGIMSALRKQVDQAQHIDQCVGLDVQNLLSRRGRICGIYGTWNNTIFQFHSRAVIMATGSIGGLFNHTTTPLAAYGSGLSMAARNGATIRDPEFIQFHPTGIDVNIAPAPLATEALRGAGAKLINTTGDNFIRRTHDLAELAPRDIVARAIWQEKRLGQKVYLDCRKLNGKTIQDDFPTVNAICIAHNIDPATTPIPVTPVVHYHMGGIKVDKNGRSDVAGLWAAGEVASFGIHGANRLASNSLLEAAVFAPSIAKDIKAQISAFNLETNARPEILPDGVGDETSLIKMLRRKAYNSLGLVRNAHDLGNFLNELIELDRQKTGFSLSLRNRLIALRLITYGALKRQESRGAHFRSDFPNLSSAENKSTYLKLDDVNQNQRAAADRAIRQGEDIFGRQSG